VVEDRAFVAGCDGKLHIIDLTKGKLIAQVELDGPTGVTPAVMGNHVYFGTEGGVFFAINWKEAKVSWTYQDSDRGQPFRSSAAVTPECVVVGSRNKRVQALDPKTGKGLWQFVTRARIDSSPVIVGQQAFVGSSDGRLYAINLKTGKETWQYETGDGFSGSPAVAAGCLVIASDEGTVYCFKKSASK
jgi:outer membrane protein assembly factor BamB